MKIAIIGAGTMGQGIAQVCAQAGLETVLFDINAAAAERAHRATQETWTTLGRKGKITPEAQAQAEAHLTITTNFNDLVADVLLEAVVERLDVKQELFRQLAAQNRPDTILASNTSSIPITRIAAGVPGPERVVGLHFFNPAPIMKLVEVIAGAATSEAVVQQMIALTERLGKVPARVRDSPGFIVNRVARPYYTENLRLLEEGVAPLETLDELLESAGFRMGAFRLMDLIGVDTNFSVTSSLFEAFHYEDRFRPNRIQQQKVDAGHWGRKAGKGFYDYPATPEPSR
jgi:3-hydroxybutyryl-CoA dehydrogenase